MRQFTIANSHHPDHTVQTRALHAYLRWRNANALAADHRARVESVALEAPPRVLRERMGHRLAPVPPAAVERLVRGWE